MYKAYTQLNESSVRKRKLESGTIASGILNERGYQKRAFSLAVAVGCQHLEGVYHGAHGMIIPRSSAMTSQKEVALCSSSVILCYNNFVHTTLMI